jgi:hypothetical protein
MYIIRTSKQVTTTHYICPSRYQCYLWYKVNTKYYIYVWKLNQTVLELDFWAVKLLFARLLSNYNIRHTCNIYTRLETCIMSISRLSLWEKVTHRLLNLHFYWADVVGWCRTLDIMLRDRCCSASMVRAQIPLKEEQNLTAQNLILTLFGLICRRIYNM